MNLLKNIKIYATNYVIKKLTSQLSKLAATENNHLSFSEIRNKNILNSLITIDVRLNSDV